MSLHNLLTHEFLLIAFFSFFYYKKKPKSSMRKKGWRGERIIAGEWENKIMKFFKEKKNTFYEVKNNSSSFLFPFLSRERPTTCGFFKCFTKERHLIIIMGERDSRDSLKNNTTKKHEKVLFCRRSSFHSEWSFRN